MSSRVTLASCAYSTYRKSNATELYHVYDKFSAKKAKAWEYCKELCYKMDGKNLKVISHNSFIFTAGFEYADPETGVAMFMYITPSYDTAVEI